MIPRRLPVLGCPAPVLHGLCLILWVSIAVAAEPAATLLVAAPPGPLARLVDTVFVIPFAQAAHVAAAMATPGPTAPPTASPTASPTPAATTAPTTAPAAPAAAAPPPGVVATVSLVDGQSLLAGCRAGLFRKLDWSAIGGRDRLLPQAASDCGMGAVLRGLVLAWSRDKFSGAPTWADFWDVAKVPGKRGLRYGARGNLEFALMADGVSPGDVYSTLRDPAGVERAFRKLDQLKPYIVWWKTDDEAPRLLASGDVLMTSAPAGVLLAAAKATSGVAPRDFAVQWTGALLTFDSWVIPATVANPDIARRFLAFASDPRRQKALGAFPGYGSAVTGGTDELGAAEKADSPATPANLSAGLMVDQAFWRDNGARLEKLYESWLTKP
jgi:putative spermidine/putrescine transport system substrate-binding protein